MKNIIILCMFFSISVNVIAVNFYNVLPDWMSTEVYQYSTGCAWVDINGDGLPDLVVADGNDILRQTLKVYYNTGNGIEDTASWQSDDIDYNGHLAVGDVTGNGYPDVVVSVYLGPQGFGNPGYIKLYENQGGELTSLPVWVSETQHSTFSCILVDLNLNGYLDLAVATGEAYYSIYESNVVFFNNEGVLESSPSWVSQTLDASYDVTFADFDKNGYPDLVFVSSLSANMIYFNYETGLETSPGWIAGDSNKSANSVTVADFNNDGWMDIAVSDNKQLQHNPMNVSARFKIYHNNEGTVENLPSWESTGNYYGSGIEAIDLNNDGFVDLVAGGWWESLKIYMNNGGELSQAHLWSSSTQSVVEAIVFTDIYQNDLQDSIYTITNQTSRYFDIFDSNVYSVDYVKINDTTLSPDLYKTTVKPAGITLLTELNYDDVLEIYYKRIIKPDMAVSNWGSYKNYIFYYQDETHIDDSEIYNVPALVSFNVYPNPISLNKKQFAINVNQDLRNVCISLYNIKGQKIYTQKGLNLKNGSNEINLKLNNQTGSGIYFLKLDDGLNDPVFNKIIMIK